METVKTFDIVAETGATYRQVDHWARKGALDGFTISSASGQGSRRAFKPSIIKAINRTEDVWNSPMFQLDSSGLRLVLEAAALNEWWVEIEEGVFIAWGPDAARQIRQL